MSNVIDFKERVPKGKKSIDKNFQSTILNLSQNLMDLSKSLTILQTVILDLKSDIEKQEDYSYKNMLFFFVIPQ